MRLDLRTFCFVLPLALAACGGEAAVVPPKTAVAAGAPTAATTATAPTTAAANGTSVAAPARDVQPSSVLRRSALREVTAAGLGAFLQHVNLDDHPVFVAGKFHGFRIVSLGDPMWRSVDLRAGDVVTRVNGFTIEHPEDALEAFKSLDVASEVHVDYERDGVPRELRYAVDEDAGDANPAPAAPPSNAKGTAPAPAKGGVKVLH